MKHAPRYWKKYFVILCLASAVSPAGAAQETLRVQVSAKISSDTVPLNRTALYLVELKWSGALAQIEFDQPETPRLTNFKLAGSSSSNWVGVENGINTAVKTFEYTLKPEAMGMGYVDGLRLTYLDKATNERHTLYADRLGFKVLEAVREPEAAPWRWVLMLAAAVAIVAGVGVWQWKAGQKKKAREQNALALAPPLAQEFLEQLQAAVDLNSLEAKTGFSEISRLLRQFLQGRFDIPRQGIATAEVLIAYRAVDGDIARGLQLEEILQTCDVAKFSGESGDPARLARVYALAQNFLRAHLPVTNAVQ